MSPGNLDLFWPGDQRWFVATDVDFWSLYIGGPSGFIAELAESVPTCSEVVDLDLPLEIEELTTTRSARGGRSELRTSFTFARTL